MRSNLPRGGIQFTNRKQDKYAMERMNRTIKEATIKRYHYDTHTQLETHVTNFIAAYNYARRLKTLKGLTPFE